MKLADYLQRPIDLEDITTEDVLASFLPLVRETLEAHRAGLVAPLEGLEDLHVDGARIWFETSKRLTIRNHAAELRRVEAARQGGVDVLNESRRTTEVGVGEDELISLEIGRRGEPVQRPVFLPGYVTWEHELAHHDPLTDVFSLGMLLASLACHLNLNEPTDLQTFVVHRRNLFAINPHLHPVLAQAILRMTELDRHRRLPDLAAALASLENYRDQTVSLEIDLARLPGLHSRDVNTKTGAILTKLRERLFDISRRNTLLHFRPTLGTVNLTQSSIPLRLDVRTIRDDQILIWNEALRQQITSGKPISLNKHLNFAEAIYLPSLLERIIADARRDQQEYGFAQLRLVVCFLNWANLKVKPAESFVSPLVLLPVKLSKTKGIRDTYQLEALSSEAEVNPVLRHQFQSLYGIALPETVDLSAGGLESLLDYLTAQVQASEPAVTVNRIDRPRIELIHEKAKRRLDQYRRTARIAGRGVRSFLNLDYSYDSANYHPLGIKLFSAKVRTPASQLRSIIDETPRPRSYVSPAPDADVLEKERSFYHVRDGSEENPYLWNIDLCSLTLGNFRYRRMSLVRDYEALLQSGAANAAFDATFSLTPRPTGRETLAAPALNDRFDVIQCDPTQAIAIAETRRGESYIVQGPPGTGKSQTITNLIADAVARGKRVLFVCEKRAAIDVVFARLRQCGLGSLCSLIHDSQADKKEFVLDLKQTYESFLSAASEADKTGSVRTKLLEDLERELRPLQHFYSVMDRELPAAGLPARRFLDRCLLLRDSVPELPPEQYDRLPPYADWWQHREHFDALRSLLEDLRSDGVLARHPLRLLNPKLTQVDRPAEVVIAGVEQAAATLEQIKLALERSGAAAEYWSTWQRLGALVAYARRIEPIAQGGNLSLFDERSQRSQAFAKALQRIRTTDVTYDAAQKLTAAWRKKLPQADLAIAIAQTERLEGKWWAWFSPAWWRLRSVLHSHYDFASHSLRPPWSHILAALQTEYDAQEDRLRVQHEVQEQFQLARPPAEFEYLLHELRPWVVKLPDWLKPLHPSLLVSDDAATMVTSLAAIEPLLTRLASDTADVLVDYQGQTLDAFRDSLSDIRRSTRQIPQALSLLKSLSDLPAQVGRTLRESPLNLRQAEAAIASATWKDLCQSDRDAGQYQGEHARRSAQQLESLYDSWLAANSQEICRRVQHRFLENVRLASLPAAQLTPEQKELKKSYGQGRRALEHEFGKSMRYRAIRELVDGEPGLVVRDLKPVWLMSPLSVSDTLPLSTRFFDIVIFDEASQVPLEEAIPSLFRGEQVVIVGDEMQLPPTDFFATKGEEDESVAFNEAQEHVNYDLSSDSLLNHAAKNLPSTMLQWHYRSRSESLISFSNWAFYDSRLLTVPDERLAVQSADSLTGLDLLLSRALSFHHLERAVYDNRRNRGEAEYVAQMVCDLLKRKTGMSMGVIAFSEAQQTEIEGALSRLAQQDAEFRALYEEELVREVDDQFVGLLVKNLENIQGDERDIILLSVCYGPGPTGKMLMNFGPINQSGGEKRLNVAFSRAKQHMAIITSIRHAQITNEYNEGANCLKNYLRYAEAVSQGDVEAARRVLKATSRGAEAKPSTGDTTDPLTSQLATALRQLGYLVDERVGSSHFRVDLAVRCEGDSVYRLGILVDSPQHFSQQDPLEREMLRPRLLRRFGWNVTSVLGKDWYENSQGELERLQALLASSSSPR